ncbi:MAG: hypothetical protein DELT_02297 [Desulfovibrio sp.]
MHQIMHQIFVRYRAVGEPGYPAFTARNYQALSLEKFRAAEIPEGFAETPVPATGATLAQAVYLSGKFQTPALCSGIGRCGLCRVRFISEPPAPAEAEKTVLSHHDLDAGWRLACRHAPAPGMRVLIPAAPVETESPAENSAELAESAELGAAPACLAVDLGTTSIHWQFVSPEPGNDTLPHGITTNPQMGAGSDVISRLAYASIDDGAAVLCRLTVQTLQRIIREGERQGLKTRALCVAANPAMSAILFGQNTRQLSRAPYALPDRGDTTETVPGLPPVYTPPHVSPFVGADISAGYAAIALAPAKAAPEFPFLLADLGTNGECILALAPDTAFAASLPMGPALEGVNLAYGSQAVPGAVTEYSLTPYGLEPKILGGTTPAGITATGYLSLLRILRASNLLDENGLFIRPQNTLGERLGGSHADSHSDSHNGGEPFIRLPGKMVLFASDVEEILKVKAAFTLAVSRLLAAAALNAADLNRVYLAGALGEHIPVTALVELGFLPTVLGSRVTAAGNTALEGAALLLRNEPLRTPLAAWARRVASLDLANDPAFTAAFAEHMTFAWKR